MGTLWRTCGVKLEEDAGAPVRQQVRVFGEDGVGDSGHYEVRHLCVGLVGRDHVLDAVLSELEDEAVAHLSRDADCPLVAFHGGREVTRAPQLRLKAYFIEYEGDPQLLVGMSRTAFNIGWLAPRLTMRAFFK